MIYNYREKKAAVLILRMKSGLRKKKKSRRLTTGVECVRLNKRRVRRRRAIRDCFRAMLYEREEVRILHEQEYKKSSCL